MNIPQVEVIENSISLNPSGVRHTKVPASGFLRLLSTGTGGTLNFGDLDNTTSGIISETKLIYFRASNMGDASGIFNIRFYLSSTSDWNEGNYRFLYRPSFHFIPNASLSLSDSNVQLTPLMNNVSGTISTNNPFGAPWISGILDRDASNYIYLAVYVDSDVPIGTYGGQGDGGFRYRFLYDFS